MDENETVSAETQEDGEEQQNPRRGPRLKTVFTILVTLLLAVLAFLAFLYRDWLTGDGLRRLFRQESAAEESESFTYEIGSGQVFAPAGSGLAVASSSAIELMNASGRTVFKQVVSYGTAAVSAFPDGALFCDLGGHGCVYARMNGESISPPVEGDIITASVNDSGWFTLVTDTVGYKGLVNVYDSSGTARYQWWSGTGYVLKASVSPDNRMLAVLCAETGGGRLHLFRMDREEELALTEFPAELPYDFGFLGNDTVCTVSEDALSFVSAEGEVKGRYELGENYLLDYDLGSQSFVAFCVGAYRAGGTGEIRTLDKTGKTLGTLEITRDLVSLSASGRQLLVMTSGSIAVYGQDLTVLYEESALITAKKALLRSDGDILLLSAYAAERRSY